MRDNKNRRRINMYRGSSLSQLKMTHARLIGMPSYQQVRRILSEATQELTVLNTLLWG